MIIFPEVKAMDSNGGVVGKITLKQEENGNFTLTTRYTAQIAKQFADDLNYLVSDEVYNSRTDSVESLENFYAPNKNVNWINEDSHARLRDMELPLYYYNESDLRGFPDLVREFDSECSRMTKIAAYCRFNLVIL